MFAFILALIGAGLATVTGWLGGELVDRLGIGVDLHMEARSLLRWRLPCSSMAGPDTTSSP